MNVAREGARSREQRQTVNVMLQELQACAMPELRERRQLEEGANVQFVAPESAGARRVLVTSVSRRDSSRWRKRVFTFAQSSFRAPVSHTRWYPRRIGAESHCAPVRYSV